MEVYDYYISDKNIRNFEKRQPEIIDAWYLFINETYGKNYKVDYLSMEDYVIDRKIEEVCNDLFLFYIDIDNEKLYHANALIRFRNYFIRFEPHGRNTESFNNKKIDKVLEEYFKSLGYRYISPKNYQGPKGPQMYETVEKYDLLNGLNKSSGFCLAWSLRFMHIYEELTKDNNFNGNVYRLINEIINVIMDNSNSSLCGQIRGYTTFLASLTCPYVTRSHKKLKECEKILMNK